MYHVDHAAIVFLLTDGLLFLLQLSSLICTKHIEYSSAVLSGPIPIVADFLLLKGNAKISYSHRRRMEREAKAKVVASVWGADFVQFLAALAVLPRSFLEEMDEFKHVFQTCT